ncbi:Glycosyltransferase [Methanosarcina siciliae T4/M]|uniref:Glycosyltransferase n=1 Tax=Methanosarcina siciliae T4/M TaxID=1434120 RepID=A0A0E3P9D7_9EURY|nr:glycosyltransferase family 4 protein [Methanosarcina siciliae]AKB29740.1 Glycosyltransferase [Methanosarcina siciliae T4/M]
MPQKTLKKRVISICNISPTKFGSFEEFIVALTDKLKDNNFEHLIIFRDKPIKIVEDSLLNKGAKIEIIKPSKYNIKNFIEFYRIIKKNQPDIVHFHFYPIYTIVNYLSIISDVRIVYTDHMGGKEAKTKFKKMIRLIYYNVNSKLFSYGINRIICVSKFTKLKYVKDYGIHPKNLCVIYNGINIERFNKRCEVGKIKEKYKVKDEFIITCVGLRKDKGVHYLIKEIPSIIKQIPNIKIILVGEGECRNYLETQVQEYDLKKYVIFTGQISNIEEVFCISSCVVMPTLVEEACPYTALESMAIGVPVIGFDSGGLKEIVIDGQNGYIIPKKSKALVEKIVAIHNKELIDSMGEKCKKRILEKFSLLQCTNKYVELYTKI